ncbi:UDP-N-acetylmuramoyl-L-alanyl-D-glutamate--2,6-diaminopimelate ligase [Brachybacterium phenoliresistens]|uniref:UDP-N-acetylmuramoyl-L-alanyl-D-glutamate--2,6-diaminopimelate ligase n=1 Tax=Brachybacterium phenoliresistens TaxID=396014 RepID=Z9JU09_9MICO|nr:UDP-N-acetylmuramoyl-L-alanyl-D-glutamate--2,6-diaminopimelate ligase [Brachybacterium phenoliresistens]EWS81252.1 UDP-N-acetylmuramyl peptide synthase [Brachybacterium phenoliresistens]
MTAHASPEPPRPRETAPLPVADLAGRIGARLQGPAPRAPITGITLDSRSVRPGDLWAALPGARAHGADFADQAASRGAACALTDAQGAQRCADAGLPALVIQDPRAATAQAAAAVYGEPAERLATLAVTGTNGKTSVTTMAHRTLLALGRSSGVIGTSGTSFVGDDGTEHAVATVRTTPEAPEVHGILARMVEQGVGSCAMEVSSHALVLHRADGVVFDVACFTNLSQDHLDFHGDMESYFQAKAQLFTPAHARRGIVCVDDAWGRRLAAQASIPVTTYTTREDVPADARVRDLRADGFGSRFLLERDGASPDVPLRSPLPGRHYVANTVAVVLMLETIGVHGEAVHRALAAEGTVPGRMELVAESPVRGIVDFSHTPDALEQALVSLRSVAGSGRVIAVIGAGGDRDRSKRPLMGEVAARLADVVVVTDDNPRSEDPAEIRRALLAGVPDAASAQVHEVAGRAEGIALAVGIADVGDTILVAGKGAETGQDIGGIVHPFDDREVLRASLTGSTRTGTETLGC